MNPVEGAIVPVVGAIVPVAVVGAVAVDVEEEVAVEGEVIEILFCLFADLACVRVYNH